MKNVIVGDKSGFCFGVKRAVDLVIKCQREKGEKIYTLGPLIHNNDVINYLKGKNIYPIEINEIDKLNADDVIVIRSHGVSLEILEKLKKAGFEVIDATCPYVASIQKRVKEYYNLGYNILIVGDKNHPEVQGINGWCKNTALVAKNEGDISSSIGKRVCVVSQTTEKEKNWQNVLNSVIRNSKEIVAFNTICSATEVRQKCAEELSKDVDAMIVIGGKHSSNTTKLYEICIKNCKNTIHIERAEEIPMEILENKDIINIGITAGASTPDWIIEETVNKIKIIKSS